MLTKFSSDNNAFEIEDKSANTNKPSGPLAINQAPNSSSIGCKWSNLNAQGSEAPMSHSLLEESILPFTASAPSFLHISGVIINGSTHYKGQEGENILEQNQLNRLQMVKFDCPRVRKPWVSFFFGGIYFPFAAPASSFLPLWGNKKWEPPV